MAFLFFPNSVRYPPYSDTKLNFLLQLMKKRAALPTKYLGHILIFGLGVATALLVNNFVKVNSGIGWL